MSSHLLIAGTGRAGTSFLVRLLHELGLETHLSREGRHFWSTTANAGLEDRLGAGRSDPPYVIKSPWLFEWIDDALASSYVIDGVILPVRDLADAAASRSILEYQDMFRSRPSVLERPESPEVAAKVAGGAVYSLHPLDQARVLATGFYKVVQRLTEARIPMYFVAFPRLIDDAEYLYDCLRPVLGEVSKEAFVLAHRKIADPNQVHVRSESVDSPERAANAALKREVIRLRHELDAAREVARSGRAKGQEQRPAAKKAPKGLLHRIGRRVRRLISSTR